MKKKTKQKVVIERIVDEDEIAEYELKDLQDIFQLGRNPNSKCGYYNLHPYGDQTIPARPCFVFFTCKGKASHKAVEAAGNAVLLQTWGEEDSGQRSFHARMSTYGKGKNDE